jgi:hypothetical protein
MPLTTTVRMAGSLILAVAGIQPLTAQPPAAPPGFTLTRTGSEHDFDYFEGGWTTVQHRLAESHDGKPEWKVFPGNLCMRLYLNGHVTVDELDFPTLGTAGLTLRTFDKQKRQWSIYWVSSVSGRLDPVPTIGGFEGNRGEFYAEDQIDGRPVKVRYLWTIKDHDHARWEQAFSYDDRSWKTNWIADFARADTARICRNGRPRR